MADVAEARKLVTIEEFLELPDDGIERELIEGEVREYGMTIRNRFHGRIEARIATVLNLWLDGRPEPRGEVVVGDTGFRIRPETVVGPDVAYVSPKIASTTDPASMIFQGPPVLAVEIFSPSDRQSRIHEKVDLYLEAGVRIVWLIDPKFRTITVCRPGCEPETINVLGELTAAPELPGFRVATAKLFA